MRHGRDITQRTATPTTSAELAVRKGATAGYVIVRNLAAEVNAKALGALENRSSASDLQANVFHCSRVDLTRPRLALTRFSDGGLDCVPETPPQRSIKPSADSSYTWQRRPKDTSRA